MCGYLTMRCEIKDELLVISREVRRKREVSGELVCILSLIESFSTSIRGRKDVVSSSCQREVVMKKR